jgi:hypothetical protein
MANTNEKRDEKNIRHSEILNEKIIADVDNLDKIINFGLLK